MSQPQPQRLESVIEFSLIKFDPLSEPQTIPHCMNPQYVCLLMLQPSYEELKLCQFYSTVNGLFFPLLMELLNIVDCIWSVNCTSMVHVAQSNVCRAAIDRPCTLYVCMQMNMCVCVCVCVCVCACVCGVCECA